MLIDHQKLKKRLWDQTVLIDTNIIIYLLEETPPYADLARFVMRNLEDGRFFGVLSLISVVEVMQGPLRKEQPGLAQDVKSYLLTFPNIKCQGIDERVLDLIGRDSRVSWKNLRTIDSLIVSCGLVRNATAVLSNDLRWKRAISSDFIV
ncbi:MAG: PIN domain-containing protein [Thermodesulfobacteriota bacterium]|nr:PIN domain-containing protein [Thermodesulfobacteriota bacterium]